VTFDSDFAAVVDACAARRGTPGTWITPEMRAYCELHAQGHAHKSARLMALYGGLYGVP
jgi:leucyl/phenylalanyl-tRNA--protein transferase